MRLVRIRLVLALVATATVAVVCGAALWDVIAADPQHHLAAAIRGAPVQALAMFTIAIAGTCTLTYYLVRQVLRPAEEVGLAHQRLTSLYESARARSLEDSLTGLGNHRAFQDEFDRQLAAVRRYGTSTSLILIDLDDFKSVNDSAGHAVGDDLLVELSRIVKGGIRRSDRPFRIGGDEFALLLPETSPEEARVVARRILSTCLEPRTQTDFTQPFSFSAGITGAPSLGLDRNELFRQADEALYECKRNGRTGIGIHDPTRVSARTDSARLLGASGALIEIIETHAVRPAYQPLVDLRTGVVVGFEGLIRPIDGSTVTDASNLFEIAEATGRTTELDHLSIEAILAGASQLGSTQSIGLNLSPKTIGAPEFSPQILINMLRAVGLAPERAVLEVTERQGVDDFDRLRHSLAACQSAGFRVAVDDVGAGNSGLRLLSQVRFDIVKIDLSLVQAGARRDASLEVLRSVADLATRWGAKAVAEGIETPAQLRMVRSLGLSEGQGYLLGRPTAAPLLRTVDLDALSEEIDFLTLLRSPLTGVA
jgi:diguanylate cyclase (GGDEF)-like protein